MVQIIIRKLGATPLRAWSIKELLALQGHYCGNSLLINICTLFSYYSNLELDFLELGRSKKLQIFYKESIATSSRRSHEMASRVASTFR
jgi:hypothetical protein